MAATDFLPALHSPYLATFARMVVGVVFAVSALGKTRNPPAFERAITNFHIVPAPLVKMAAYLLLCAEFMVFGLMLLGGRFLWVGFLFAVLLLLAFSAALLSVLVRGIKTSCNCFGPAEKPVTGSDLLRNVGFIGWAVVGWWVISSPDAQASLKAIEQILLAFLATAFVISWSKVGEIGEIVRGL